MRDSLHEPFKDPEIKYRLRDDVLRPRLDLPIEAPEFLIHVDRAGIGSDADTEPCRLADGVPGKVESMVEPIHDVGEANRVDIEDRSGIRITPKLRRISRDGEDIAHAERPRTEQVRLHADDIPVATSEVEDCLDPHLALDDPRKDERRHACRGTRSVGDIDRVNTEMVEPPGLRNFLGR